MKLPHPSDRQVHIGLVVFWALLIIPTLIWWRDSILWIAFMSLYAIITGHWGAYEAAKAQDIAEAAEKAVQDVEGPDD